MKRRLKFLTVILVLVLFLVSCGSSTITVTPTPTPSPSPSDTLTIPEQPFIDISKTELNILFENKEFYIDIGSTSYDDVIFDPLNRDIFGVRADGLVIPLGIGTGEVIITHNDTRVDPVTVTINIIEEVSLEVEVLEYFLEVGNTVQILFETDDPEGLNFVVSNNDVLEIDEEGLITGLSKGISTITISSVLDPSLTYQIEVNVTEVITITNYPEFIYVGLSATSEVDFKTNDILGVVYSSSNNTIFTVTETGLITGVKKGEATLTITSKINPEVFIEIEILVVEQHEKAFIEAVKNTLELTNYTFLVSAQEMLGDDVFTTNIVIKIDNNKTSFEVDQDEIYFVYENNTQYMYQKFGDKYIKEEVNGNPAEAFVLFELFEIEDFFYFSTGDRYSLQDFTRVEPFKNLFGEENRLASFTVFLKDGFIHKIEYTLVTGDETVIVVMEIDFIGQTVVEVPNDES